MPLSYKQRMFVEFYLQTWNASEASRRAGYKTDADVCGARLMVNASIREAIQERMRETTMSTDEVLRRLNEQATVDYSWFFNPDGTLNWNRVHEKGHLIKKITPRMDGSYILELHDPQTALVKIGEAYKMFVHRQSLENPDGSPIKSQADVVIYVPDNGRPRLDNAA